MASQWFCQVLGQEIGPVGFREMAEMVRAGTLKEDDRVRREGTGQWTRAGEVIGLFRTAAKEPAPTPPQAKPDPQPVRAPGKTREAEQPPAEPSRRGRRRVLLAGGLVFALVLLLAGISVWRATRRETFPERHRPGPRVAQDDPLASLAAARSDAPSTPVPDDPLPQPASDDAVGLNARLTLDFREDFETQAIKLFATTKPGADKKRPPAVEQFSIEPAGIRVTIPSGSPVEMCRGDLRIRPRGDFQITARYTILDLEPPTAGYGSGVGISIQDTSGERASLQRLVQVGGGHVFAAVRGQPGDNGKYRYRRRLQPTSSEARSGWMRLERVGDVIRYQIADPHSEQFVQIHEDEFPVDDLERVVFKNQPGASPTAVDVVWSQFDVQAERIVKEY